MLIRSSRFCISALEEHPFTTRENKRSTSLNPEPSTSCPAIEGGGPRQARWTFTVPALLQGQRVLLWGVALVVVLVSLPLLRSVAIKENEMDAVRALNLLGREVFAAETTIKTFGALLDPEAPLGRRLPDTRLVDDGRLMFHHGYLFEIVTLEAGEHQLRAWPLAHGETGLGAFRCAGPGEVLGHPNSTARWSGVNATPMEDLSGASNEGWRRIDLSPERSRAGI